MEILNTIDRFLSQGVKENTTPPHGWWRKKVEGVAALHLGYPYPGAFPIRELAESAQAVLEREGWTALQYGGGELAGSLRDFVTNWTAPAGHFRAGRELLFTLGSQHAIDLLCHLMLDPDTPVAVEAPTYLGFLTNARNYTQHFLSYPMDDEGLIVEAMAADLAARRRARGPLPRFLYTIPNFHNPTGITMSYRRRVALLDLAEEFDFLVVEDDAYGRLSFEGDPPPSLQALDTRNRVIYITTMSKIMVPGLRVAWIVAAPEIIKRLGGLHVTSNAFLHSVFAHYGQTGGLDRRVAMLRQLYGERCHRFLALLDEHMPVGTRYSRPAGGFFVWLGLPGGVSAQRVFERGMVPNGVAVMPGQTAYADGRGDDHLRLSFSFAGWADMERGVRLLGRLIAEETHADVDRPL